MTELLSNYREGGSSFSHSFELLSDTFYRDFGKLTGIILLMGGYGTDCYEMMDSLRSSLLVFFKSSLNELSLASNAKSQVTEIPEKDEINLDTDLATQQIVREVEPEALQAHQPVSVKNPPKGHCAYCAAYLFSISNNPGFRWTSVTLLQQRLQNESVPTTLQNSVTKTAALKPARY